MTNIKRLLSLLPLLGLLCLTFLFEIWHLYGFQLNEFDEGRFTANAFEMMQNGDYFNLYYMGEPDEWVARPPLKSWLIILGYKLLGFNVYGARLSSICAIVLFMLYAYKLSRLFLGQKESLLVCLMLIGCKGIIGFHVGRSADMDAELVFFLLAFAYHFVQYSFFDLKKHSIYWGIFLALSFLLKTTASVLYLPGVFLFLFTTSKLKKTVTDKYFWLGLSIYLIAIAAWAFQILFYGTTYKQGQYAGTNALQTMIIYDTWMRFTSSKFDGHAVEQNWAFFIHVLDSKFNIWNYLSYGGIIIWIISRFKSNSIKTSIDFFMLFCICIIIPPSLLLTFGMHKLDWYASPTLYFLAFFASFFIHKISSKWQLVKWLYYATILFALARHFLFINDSIKETTEVSLMEAHKAILKSQPLFCLKNTPSNVYTWLCWSGLEFKLIGNTSDIKTKKATVIGRKGDEEPMPEGFEIIAKYRYQSFPNQVYIAKYIHNY